MKEIEKIIITGHSGYCNFTYAYYDRLVITNDHIAYDYRSLAKINSPRKWRYETNSELYTNTFIFLKNIVSKLLEPEVLQYALDAGEIKITAIYSDKTKKSVVYYDTSYLEEFIEIIKNIIPNCELMPESLYIEEDEE